MKHVLRPWYLTGSMLAACFAAGCTSSHYRKSADKSAYAVIKEKTPLVRNMDERFTIEQTNQVSLEGLPVREHADDFLGQDGTNEVGARILSLEGALAIAVRHNRAFQSRKEQLYLTALGLTLARHQFTPIFSGGGNARYDVSTEEVVAFVPDPENPGEVKPVLSDTLVESHRVSADGSIGVTWLIRDLGRLSAAFTTDFFRYLTGDPRTLTSSQIGATFSRPLLRNAGFLRETENLTQAERDLLYALRDFTQFRKDFSVQVATAFYGVLGIRDAVRNSYLNLQSSRTNAERTRALAREGRVTQADLGRLEQQELDAESAWIGAVRNYKQALDNFKLLQLGLPVQTNLVLDDRELELLVIQHPTLSVEDSLTVALAARLDYKNSKDRLTDAGREVKLAVNSLKTQADLIATAGFNSAQESGTGFPVPDLDRYRWSAGLNVDLPFDRTSERNAFRAALINEQQAIRALEQQEDEIKLDVRESWRTLDQAKRSYEISEIGVRIAERRVEEQNLLAELGRAKAQDQVDAQNSLNSSKNQRTQAIVTHTIARLQFWNNMGILYIKDNGQWEEVTDGGSQ